jgi:hypothetical protein
METAFVTEIIKAIGEGNVTKGMFLILVFVVVWLQLRALQKQFKNLNTTITTSFAKGEERFKTIETDVHQIRTDLDQFKKQIPTGGMNNERFSEV